MSSKTFTVKTYDFIRTLCISIVAIKGNLGGESAGNYQGVILRRNRRISLLRQRPEARGRLVRRFAERANQLLPDSEGDERVRQAFCRRIGCWGRGVLRDAGLSPDGQHREEKQCGDRWAKSGAGVAARLGMKPRTLYFRIRCHSIVRILWDRPSPPGYESRLLAAS